MMKMKLCLDRMNKNGLLLEHREQWSKSFTIGFMELLYLACSQAQTGASVTSTDVDMGIRLLDTNLSGVVPENARDQSDILRIGAPGGSSSLQALHIQSPLGAGGSKILPLALTHLGNDIGIQVGIGNTAVTPTDRRLSQRVGHGRRPADGAAVVFEQYTTGDDTDATMNAAATWFAQEFIPKVSHRITSVLVKIWKTGAPGDLTVSIKPADMASGPSHVPITATSPDLASGTILQAAIPAASPGALTEAVFATPIDVYAGHRYYIVCRAPGSSGGNSVQWRYDTAGATYERAWDVQVIASVFTRRLNSADSGANWTSTGGAAHMFQEKGQSVGEFVVGGCELDNLTFSNPNGSFDIRRYFTNNCGAGITIVEAGIYASAHIYGVDNRTMRAWPFLIARDVFAGVLVNNTEILRVVYTPSITV